jgi:hypothetical protein
MTKSIAVVGNMPIKWDFDECLRLGSVIASGNTYKTIAFEYATANTEQHLQDMLNSANFRNTRILVPDTLYKKYIFFSNVDCLPNFPAMKTLDINDETCSEQLLSLMLACWMEIPNIYLFGYDIENLTERARLITLGISYPHSRIIYVRKPNPTKIFLFDAYDNMRVMDYIEYQKIVDKNGKRR